MRRSAPFLLAILLITGCLGAGPEDEPGVCVDVCGAWTMDPFQLGEPFRIGFVPLAFGGDPGLLVASGDWVAWMDHPRPAMESRGRFVHEVASGVVAANAKTRQILRFHPTEAEGLVSMPFFIEDGVLAVPQVRACLAACGDVQGVEVFGTTRWDLRSGSEDWLAFPTGPQSIIVGTEGPLRLVQYAEEGHLFADPDGENERLAMWDSSSGRVTRLLVPPPIQTSDPAVPRTLVAAFHGQRLIVATLDSDGSPEGLTTTVFTIDGTGDVANTTSIEGTVYDVFPTSVGLYYWSSQVLVHRGVHSWSHEGPVLAAYSDEALVAWLEENASGRRSLWVHTFEDNVTRPFGDESFGPWIFTSGGDVQATVWKPYAGKPTAFVGRYVATDAGSR